MRNRHGQFNMAHAFAAHARESDLDTTTVADDAAMLDALILSARAFPILHRTENTLAEKAAFLRLECSVVDGLRVLHFTLGPGPNRFGRSDRNGDVFDLINLIQTKQLAGGFFGSNHIQVLTLK